MRNRKTSIAPLLVCGAVLAQAAIRVDCEAKFLDELDRPEPDQEIFGLKARDLSKHVDEWQRQSLACINAKPELGRCWRFNALKP